MASIHAKNSRGQKYWYIVESRRVNGKPRPVVLAYLGKANDLLKRLNGLTEGLRLQRLDLWRVKNLSSDAFQKTDISCKPRQLHALASASIHTVLLACNSN